MTRTSRELIVVKQFEHRLLSPASPLPCHPSMLLSLILLQVATALDANHCPPNVWGEGRCSARNRHRDDPADLLAGAATADIVEVAKFLHEALQNPGQLDRLSGIGPGSLAAVCWGPDDFGRRRPDSSE